MTRTLRSGPLRRVCGWSTCVAVGFTAVAVALSTPPAPAVAQSVWPPPGVIPPGTQITINVNGGNWTTVYYPPARCSDLGLGPEYLELVTVGSPSFGTDEWPGPDSAYHNVINPGAVTLPPFQLPEGWDWPSVGDVYVVADVAERCVWPTPGHFATERTGTIEFGPWSVVPGAVLPPGGPVPPAGPGAERKPLCNPARGVKPAGCRDIGLTANRLLDQFTKVGGALMDFLFFDDIRDLQDPKVSKVEKALIIVSYVVPAGKGVRITVKLAKPIVRNAPRLVATLKKGRKAIAEPCALATGARSGTRLTAVAAANCKQATQNLVKDMKKALQKDGAPLQDYINKSVLPLGERSGKNGPWNVRVDDPKAAAKKAYRDLTVLGDHKKQSGVRKPNGQRRSQRVQSDVPGDRKVIYRSRSGPDRRGPPTVEIHDSGGNIIMKQKFLPK